MLILKPKKSFESRNPKTANKKESKSIKTPVQKSIPRADTGYCIRCHADLPFNPEKPLCKDDYNQWKKYEMLLIANFCHKCGKPWETSLEKPLCLQCYKELL